VVDEEGMYVPVVTLKQAEEMKEVLVKTQREKILKEAMKKELNTDKFELMSVEYDEEQFKIKTVPWSIIALELIKEARS